MNSFHQQRLIYIIVLMSGLSLAIALILYAFKQNINVFLTPSEIIEKHIPNNYHLRLGGMVKAASLWKDPNSLKVKFLVTDGKQQLLVKYEGILPDLFREGKGVIAEGKLDQANIFIADIVLAKHDENYMPPSLKKSKT